MTNPHRGHEQYQPSYFSARQRLVVLTFATPAEAEEWDRTGKPIPACEPVAG